MDRSTIVDVTIAVGRIIYLSKIAVGEFIFEHLQALQRIRKYPAMTFNAAASATDHIRRDPSVPIWIAEYRLLLEHEGAFELRASARSISETPSVFPRLPVATMFAPLDKYLRAGVIQVVRSIEADSTSGYIEEFRRQMDPYFMCSRALAANILNHVLKHVKGRTPVNSPEALAAAGKRVSDSEYKPAKRQVTRIRSIVFCASKDAKPMPRETWNRVLELLGAAKSPLVITPIPASLPPTEHPAPILAPIELAPTPPAEHPAPIEHPFAILPPMIPTLPAAPIDAPKIRYLVSRHHIIGTPVNQCFELADGVAVPVAGKKVEVKFDDIETRLEPPAAFGQRAPGLYYVVAREDVAAVYGIATIRAPLDSLKIAHL